MVGTLIGMCINMAHFVLVIAILLNIISLAIYFNCICLFTREGGGGGGLPSRRLGVRGRNIIICRWELLLGCVSIWPTLCGFYCSIYLQCSVCFNWIFFID